MTAPRVVHTGRAATYWEVAPGLYQATRSPSVRPAMNGAGYRNLATLCRLKGDTPPTTQDTTP
jgi:hypothetical protein